jgi:hypothetical protein
VTVDADEIRRKVRDGELDPADAEQVLRFAAFLRNAGPPGPREHPLPPNTLAYAMGEDVEPEGTEHL